MPVCQFELLKMPSCRLVSCVCYGLAFTFDVQLIGILSSKACRPALQSTS